MLQLRPQQETAKHLLYDSFNQGNRAVIVCAPTGFGKTVLFSNIVREMLENGVSCMIMCDQKELLDQAEEKLNMNGLYPVVINPDYTHKVASLYLASVDTLRNRKFPEIDFIIIDEAHKRDFDKIILWYLENFPHIKVAGFTGTPVRTGKSEIEDNDTYTGQLIDIYQDLIIPTTMAEQFEHGYLVPAVYTSVEMDVSDVKITNTKDGLEYNQSDAYKKFDKPQMYAGTIDNYRQFSDGFRAICFNQNVEHSKKTTQAFNDAGIPAIHVDGKTKKKARKEAFDGFLAGKYLVLCNFGVATTGYDNPRVRTIILNRLIYSFSLYEQMCGRGGRPCPDDGKDCFLVIDQGANYIKHGYWGTEREYYLDPEKAKRVLTGVAVMVNCEKCDSFISAAARVCPFCSEVKPMEEKTDEPLAQGEFKLLDMSKALKKPVVKMSVAELEEYRESKNYSIGWIVRQLFTRGENALWEYQNLKNYAKSWVPKQIELAETAKNNTAASVWEFVQNNPHLTDDQVKDFMIKKLKTVYSIQDIEIMVPEVLEARKQLQV
jgi:superfamily II DNA or RNA helicase